MSTTPEQFIATSKLPAFTWASDKNVAYWAVELPAVDGCTVSLWKNCRIYVNGTTGSMYYDLDDGQWYDGKGRANAAMESAVAPVEAAVAAAGGARTVRDHAVQMLTTMTGQTREDALATAKAYYERATSSTMLFDTLRSIMIRRLSDVEDGEIVA